nr:hypothetical protein [Tanacetum cinerariifolium]
KGALVSSGFELSSRRLEEWSRASLPAPSAIVTPSFEFPLALVVAPLEIRRRSSSSHSSSDHSLSGHSRLGHSLSRHTPPDTIDADSSTPSRFVNPLLARTLWCSKSYLHWRSVPLSTMYPPMISELLAKDSSFESFAGISCKRCRPPAATVTSSIHATRALVPSRADLLPPHKRFRDSISPEDSVEEDIDTDVLEDIKADATTIEVVVDKNVKVGIDVGIGMEINVRIDVEDEVESNDRGTMDVGLDVVTRINIPDGMLMPNAVERLEGKEYIAGGERASLLEHVASLERSNARIRDTMMMERARADRFQRHMRFIESELRQIRRFCYYDMMRFRRLETFAVRRLVAPEVGVAVVASPAGLLELDTHSLSKDGPSKSSPPPVSVAPMVLPFLCSNDSESDTEIPKRHVSPIPHDSMLTKWRSRPALRSLSPTNSILEIPTAPILPAPSAIVTPSSEFLLALVVAPPEIHRRRAILI